MKAGLSEAARTQHDRADPRGGGDAAVAVAARWLLPGDRRAGDRLRSEQLDHPLDRAAAGGGAARDGGDTGADLLRAPATLAARGGAARRGAHVRGAVARGSVADDGLDRGAAGARGAGGGLRDPVPVARRGGLRARGERGATGRRSSGARPPSAARRSPPPPPQAPAAMLVLVLSPVPMVRSFGALLVVGVGIAFAVRTDRGRGGAGAGRAPLVQVRGRAARRRAPAGRVARARASCCSTIP